jgi:branched-chain amino acid transport system substrate-binding protein
MSFTRKNGHLKIFEFFGNIQNSFHIATLIFLIFSSCAVAQRPTPEQQANLTAKFQKAEAYYRNHFYQRALEAYQQVLAEDPKGDFAPSAIYKIAGIHMREERPEKAVLYFARLQAEFPKSPFAQEALYNQGYCYFKMEDPTRALEAYKAYLALPEARNKSRARALAAEALDALGKYEEALRFLAEAGAQETDRDKQVEILQQAKKIIEERLSTAKLLDALPSLKPGVIGDYTRFRIAQDSVAAGDRTKARELLAGIDFKRGRFQFYKDAQDLASETRKPDSEIELPVIAAKAPEKKEKPQKEGASSKPDALTIGVVLPLSGKFQVFGEQALHGIMLGVDRQAQRDMGGARLEVLVRDSEGDPDTAARMVTELAAQERVLAIVGPLLVKESEPAADEADRVQIPMLTMSRKEGLAANRNWVFRNAITFQHQARALIQYASTHQSVRRFAVMYPENEFGEAFRIAFEKELDPGRLSLVAETGYPADATDFRRQCHAIVQAGDAEAVFIPDDAEKIALIAPQLVYYGVKDVDLLGPSSWNDDALARKAGAYLKRAVIADGFFADAPEPAVRDFAGKYEDQFGEKPTLLSALGYDGVGLLARVAKSGNADTRSAVRRGLLQIRNYPGLTGRTTFYENGEAEKDLYLLQVGSDRIELKY